MLHITKKIKMKNIDIHNNLEKKELRDFISISFENIFKKECLNKKVLHPYNSGSDSLEWCIKDNEENLKFIENSIEYLKERRAVIEIMKMLEWKEFDVSDETEKHPDNHSWLSFIGNQNDYETFIKNIKSEIK